MIGKTIDKVLIMIVNNDDALIVQIRCHSYHQLICRMITASNLNNAFGESCQMNKKSACNQYNQELHFIHCKQKLQLQSL